MKGLRRELMYPSHVVRRKAVIGGSRSGRSISMAMPDQVLHRKKGNQQTKKQTVREGKNTINVHASSE